MMENRSVPPNTVLPHVMYQNLGEAIAWLTKTLGFIEHYRYGEPSGGAQMHLGNAWIMLRSARPGAASPARLGYGTQSLTVFVVDVDAHYQKRKRRAPGFWRISTTLLTATFNMALRIWTATTGSSQSMLET